MEEFESSKSLVAPWEVLLDIGHNASYMYDFLIKVLSEHRPISEKQMAETLLQLSINHSGTDDAESRLVYNLFEANRDGNGASLKKEPDPKKNNLSWCIENLARAFRELYPTINWAKVFDSLAEMSEDELEVLDLDAKQFQTFLSLFNKSKPHNYQFQLQSIIT